MSGQTPERYDAIVVGSGFGGAMVCHSLAAAGGRTLLLERGDWVSRQADGASADPIHDFFQLTSAYTTETAYVVGQRLEGICACVGGPSVFYGGASFRFREADFLGAPEIIGGSGAQWPFDYAELEPYYARAEAILGVAGRLGDDPTEPPRSGDYPRSAVELAPISERLAAAARALGLHPSRVPLAFDERCTNCLHCDGYACASGSKQDLAAVVIPALVDAGVELRPRTVVRRILAQRGRVVGVEVHDLATDRRAEIRAERVVLAAGALASPHLLLSSGLAAHNPGGEVVGRYLMRHCNAFVYSFFTRDPNPLGLHHKQVAINDFYFGDDAPGAPPGKLGNLQQVMHPQPGGILRAPARSLGRGGWLGRSLLRGLGAAVNPLSRRMTGLQVIAEDQPQASNRIEVDATHQDRFGLPIARIHHRYSSRDLAARDALVRRARSILNEIPGGRVVHVHRVETFSHAVGTVRAGIDPRRSALDVNGAFRGVENLYVADGSFLPTSGGLNPSLTIAANALRVGDRIAGR